MSVIAQCVFYQMHFAFRDHCGLLHMFVPEAKLEEHFNAAELAGHISDLLFGGALGRQGMPLE
ncbi:MAG: hypothetical protein R6U98_36685 [Pirellulaceae bacterium]